MLQDLMSMGFDNAMLLVCSYCDPVRTIAHAKNEGYSVVDYRVTALPFGTYSSEPKVPLLCEKIMIIVTDQNNHLIQVTNLISSFDFLVKRIVGSMVRSSIPHQKNFVCTPVCTFCLQTKLTRAVSSAFTSGFEKVQEGLLLGRFLLSRTAFSCC